MSASDENIVTFEPDNFPLGPSNPQQEVTVTINRVGLDVGDHSVKLFIQPFSDTFGLINQSLERDLTFQIAEALPTPTPGPSLEGLSITPEQPLEGDLLSVTATGFEAGEPVLLELVGAERTISDALAVADAQGVYTYQIDLSTVPAGSYTLTVTGSRSEVRGETTLQVIEGVSDAVVASDELNLRLEPSYEASVIEVLVRGDELTVIAVNGDDSWLEVITATGEQGWVVTNLVRLNVDLATIPWNSAYPTP